MAQQRSQLIRIGLVYSVMFSVLAVECSLGYFAHHIRVVGVAVAEDVTSYEVLVLNSVFADHFKHDFDRGRYCGVFSVGSKVNLGG
ncbi:MAG: hypothetical protein BroJett018_00590 [Chloroflexota bacterium]|nr:hypothetical protein [Chloroflexota bacterium]GIK62265.1 MAG: hypothetical protein BroJett018_00590 [Chloroflexota bacterium]